MIAGSSSDGAGGCASPSFARGMEEAADRTAVGVAFVMVSLRSEGQLLDDGAERERGKNSRPVRTIATPITSALERGVGVGAASRGRGRACFRASDPASASVG